MPRLRNSARWGSLLRLRLRCCLYAEALEEHGWTIVDSAREVHPHAEYLVAAAARLGVENLSEDTSAQYLRDSDAKVPAAMLARQQKRARIPPVRLLRRLPRRRRAK